MGSTAWRCPWDLDLAMDGDQVTLTLSPEEDEDRPALTVTLRLDREQAEGLLDRLLAAMVKAGHRA